MTNYAKSILAGVVSALGLAGAAQAAPAPGLVANSFEDLLTTPANAPELLAASDAALAAGNGSLMLVQYHHHHHHALIRRMFRPHHHHHVFIRRPMRPHHHHHHHHMGF